MRVPAYSFKITDSQFISSQAIDVPLFDVRHDLDHHRCFILWQALDK